MLSSKQSSMGCDLHAQNKNCFFAIDLVRAGTALILSEGAAVHSRQLPCTCPAPLIPASHCSLLGQAMQTAGGLSTAAAARLPVASAAWVRRDQQRPAVSLQRRAHLAAAAPPTRHNRQHSHVLPLTHAAALEKVAPAGSVDIESLEYVDGCFSVQGCLVTAASPDTVYQVGISGTAQCSLQSTMVNVRCATRRESTWLLLLPRSEP